MILKHNQNNFTDSHTLLQCLFFTSLQIETILELKQGKRQLWLTLSIFHLPALQLSVLSSLQGGANDSIITIIIMNNNNNKKK